MNGRKFGVILFAVWAILQGLLAVSSLQIQFAPIILGFILLAAGVLLLLDR